MTSLSNTLERLGLSQYLQAFFDEGFDSWETLQDITESDLEALHVKLGHRRKLQRAIIEARGQTKDNISLGAPLYLGSKEEIYRSEEDTATFTRDQRKTGLPSNNLNPGGQKRKYRRHPKPDEYAPERPPSAYVIFSNQMRDRLKGQDLSFTEIAKIVGEQWQVLSSHEKEPCERQAQAMKEKYYADLTEYKKTPQYVRYQDYLAEFRAKHSQQDNKKSKSGHETQQPSRNGSMDSVSRNQHSPPSPPTKVHEQTSNDFPESPKTQTHLDPPRSTNDRSPAVTSSPIMNFRRFPPRPGSEESASMQDTKRQNLPIHQVYNGQASVGIIDRRDLASPKTGYAHGQSFETHYSPPRRESSTAGESFPSSKMEEPRPLVSPEMSRGASPWVNQAFTLPAFESRKGNTSRTLPVPQSIAGTFGTMMAARPLEPISSASRHTSQHSIHRLDSHDTTSKSSIATLLSAGEQLDRKSMETSVTPEARGRGRFWGTD